ncbi:DUF6573 family protein [Nonomuraea purpurea]|uniref:DUF6573 family protein n=1 Tax=Nonomuraea purpurea TaxID=1849276 RepID=A0ABV8GNY3_9ACTN
MISTAMTDLGAVWVVPAYVAHYAGTFDRTIEITHAVWSGLVENRDIREGGDFDDRLDLLLRDAYEVANLTGDDAKRIPVSVARHRNDGERFETGLTIQLNDADDPRSRIVLALAEELPVDAPTRADRIASGDLVEVPADLSREASLRFPVALTRAAWEDCVAWTDADNRRKGTVQDETGRLWDVLWMTRSALGGMPRGHRRTPVFLRRTPRDRRIRKAHPATLHAAVSTENGQQVITISHPSEA